METKLGEEKVAIEEEAEEAEVLHGRNIISGAEVEALISESVEQVEGGEADVEVIKRVKESFGVRSVRGDG